MGNEIGCIQLKGLQPYEAVSQQMHEYTEQRDEFTVDQLWFLEHEAVFTQGQAGKAEHLLNPGNIPVVQSDRGGQITYHGPGQLVVYLLCDIKRLGIGPRDFVSAIEKAIVECLKEYDIHSYPKADAPGVYVERNGQETKIASLGLRIRKGRSFHGLALNVDMDLEPFQRINPCGYAGMPMAQMKDFAPDVTMKDVKRQLETALVKQLGYTEIKQEEMSN